MRKSVQVPRRIRKRAERHGWWLVALAGVAAAALAALWFVLRGGEPADEPAAARPVVCAGVKAKKEKRPEKVRTPPATRPAASAQAAAKPEVADVPNVEAEADTNAPAEEVAAPPKKEPLFRHGTEQLLVMATPSEPGGYVPPLPEITDESVAEDLAQAMKEAIRPTTNDTEQTLEMKLNVAQQKEEYRDLRKDGMTFTEYVNALREKFNEDAAYLAEARKLDESLFNDKEISDKDYKAYRAELNKSLRDRGLPELEAR